jgi:hypothetical protein
MNKPNQPIFTLIKITGIINNLVLKGEVCCSARYGFNAGPYPTKQNYAGFKRLKTPLRSRLLGMDPPANQSMVYAKN